MLFEIFVGQQTTKVKRGASHCSTKVFSFRREASADGKKDGVQRWLQKRKRKREREKKKKKRRKGKEKRKEGKIKDGGGKRME